MYVYVLLSPSALCPSLAKPANGMVTVSNDGLPGSEAKYVCMFGFRLIGIDKRTCQNGVWSGSDPTCQCELVQEEGVASGEVCTVMSVRTLA